MTPSELLARLQERLAGGGSGALVTVTAAAGSVPRAPGAKMLVFPDGSSEGTIGGGRLEARAVADAVAALAAGEPRRAAYSLDPKELGMYCGGSVEVFIDVYRERLKLLILGGGHVGERLSALAGFLGIPHWVADDRPEFARAERFPAARAACCEPPEAALRRLAPDERTAVAVVTRCHGQDLRCLAAALESRAFYIGLIASREKARRLFALCERRGLAPAGDPRVRSPIGLDLGAETPEEIALSVLAEVLAARNRASAAPLSSRVPSEEITA